MATVVYADDFSSSNFTITAPVIYSGGFGNSEDFQLFSVFSQIAAGSSTASGFGIRAGFLYFPFVSTPVVSASPGEEKASLTWTSSQGSLGWTVGGYSIGQSTVSGGPYTYTDVGNVTNKTITSLSGGTTYYFVVRPQDAFNNVIATSSQVSVTPASPDNDDEPPPSGGGGGGGGGIGITFPSQTRVIFSGRAYPQSTVTLLKDAQVAASTIAGPNANFSITLTNITTGNYIFSLYGEDKDGIRSSLLTFPVSVTSGATTDVSGIFIAPTIAVDKESVRRGENIAIFGQSVPSGDITILVNSEQEFFAKTISDSGGIYLYNFDTTPLEDGQHSTRSKAATEGEISSFSKAISFAVGNRTVFSAPPSQCPPRADLNNDCRVNLVDFSIAAFWWKRPLSQEFTALEHERLSGDGLLTLADFSIMAFHWTG